MCNNEGTIFRIYKTVHEEGEDLQELSPHPDAWKEEKMDNYGCVVWLIMIDDLLMFASTLKYQIILNVNPRNTEENYPEIEIYNGYRE